MFNKIPEARLFNTVTPGKCLPVKGKPMSALITWFRWPFIVIAGVALLCGLVLPGMGTVTGQQGTAMALDTTFLVAGLWLLLTGVACALWVVDHVLKAMSR